MYRMAISRNAPVELYRPKNIVQAGDHWMAAAEEGRAGHRPPVQLPVYKMAAIAAFPRILAYALAVSPESVA